MPRPKKKLLKPGFPTLYPLEDVRRELERLDRPEVLGRGWRKQAAAAVGMTEVEFSKHMSAEDARKFFHFEELGRIAAWVSQNYQTTPPGWPFVSFATWAQISAGLRR